MLLVDRFEPHVVDAGSWVGVNRTATSVAALVIDVRLTVSADQVIDATSKRRRSYRGIDDGTIVTRMGTLATRTPVGRTVSTLNGLRNTSIFQYQSAPVPLAAT